MKVHFVPLVLAALLLVVSLTYAQQAKPPANKLLGVSQAYLALTKAPEKARSKHNPMENDPDAVSAGEYLFADHCAECHGEAAGGGRRAPSLRAEEVQNAPPGAIFWILTNGVVRRGMPVWSKLPEPQRWQIISYLKSLGATKPSPDQSIQRPKPSRSSR